MDGQDLQDADELLMSRLEKLCEKTGYPEEAFLFVLRTMHKPRLNGVLVEHMHASELCWLLHDQAIESFGPHARTHLQDWRIRSTDDFGAIVYALVEEGLAAKTKDDSAQDFHGVFEFDSAFQTMRKHQRTDNPMQLRLSTLFIITSIVAIASAGSARLGILGGFFALCGSWIFLLGGIFVFLAVTDRSAHSILFLLMGMLLCLAGAGLFLLVVGSPAVT